MELWESSLLVLCPSVVGADVSRLSFQIVLNWVLPCFVWVSLMKSVHFVYLCLRKPVSVGLSIVLLSIDPRFLLHPYYFLPTADIWLIVCSFFSFLTLKLGCYLRYFFILRVVIFNKNVLWELYLLHLRTCYDALSLVWVCLFLIDYIKIGSTMWVAVRQVIASLDM